MGYTLQEPVDPSKPRDEAGAAREAAAVLREACEAGAELSRLVKEHASSRRASLHLDLSATDASLSLLGATTPAPLGATRPAPPPEALLCVTSVGTSTGGGSSGAAASEVDGAGGAADGGAIAAGLVLVLDRTQPPARALRLRLHGVGVTDAARGAPPPMRTLLGPHLPPNEQSAPPVAAPLLPARCIYLLPSAAFRCAKLESGGGSSDARNGFVPSSSSGAKVTDDGLRWTSNHP